MACSQNRQGGRVHAGADADVAGIGCGDHRGAVEGYVMAGGHVDIPVAAQGGDIGVNGQVVGGREAKGCQVDIAAIVIDHRRVHGQRAGRADGDMIITAVVAASGCIKNGHPGKGADGADGQAANVDHRNVAGLRGRSQGAYRRVDRGEDIKVADPGVGGHGQGAAGDKIGGGAGDRSVGGGKNDVAHRGRGAQYIGSRSQGDAVVGKDGDVAAGAGHRSADDHVVIATDTCVASGKADVAAAVRGKGAAHGQGAVQGFDVDVAVVGGGQATHA